MTRTDRHRYRDTDACTHNLTLAEKCEWHYWLAPQVRAETHASVVLAVVSGPADCVLVSQ